MGKKLEIELTEAEKSTAGTVIGTYDCSYRGSAPVAQTRGDEIASDAVSRVGQLGQPQRKVALIVTTTGVFVKDRTTGQTITNVLLRHLSYVSCLGKEKKILCYFHADPSSSIISCHVFSVKKGSTAIPNAINEAFQAQKSQRKPSQAWSDKGSNDGNNPDHKRTASTATTPSAVGVQQMPPQVFKAVYVGHTTVTEASGDAVAEEAAQKILSQKSQPTKVHVVVSGEELQVLTRDSNSMVQAALINEISYCSISKSSKKLFLYITRDHEQVMFCHVIRMKRKTRLLNAAIGTAFVVAEEAAKREKAQQGAPQSAGFARHVTSPTKERQLNTPLGLFEAQYLGSVGVESGRGYETVAEAATTLLTTKPAPTVVAIVVSGEGLKVVEALTSEVLLNTFIKNISFTTVVDDKKILKLGADKKRVGGDELFVFINHNQNLGRYTCEVFRAGYRSREVCQTINTAFTVAMDAHKKTKGNPFTAVSAKREAVQGKLFERQIHRRDLQPIRVIGMGQFGEVYLAQQVVKKGTGEKGGDTVRRAVKLLRNAAKPSDKEEFLREAESMLNFNHPNLVHMIGVAVQQRPWLCVLEFLKYGDIRTVMKVCREKSIELTQLEMMKFAVQIATGMQYLSSLGYVHMDLAARNCLLHENNQIRVGDFGLTRKIPAGKKVYTLMTTLKLPIKWMSIESMDQKFFGEMSDVWAFGVTMWEIMSYGDTPYQGIPNMDVQVKVRDGFRLSCPTGCSQAFHEEVALPCWEVNYKRRPGFAEIRKRILKFARSEMKPDSTIRDVGGLIAVKEKQKFVNYPVKDDPDFTDEGPPVKDPVGQSLIKKSMKKSGSNKARRSTKKDKAKANGGAASAQNPFLSAANANGAPAKEAVKAPAEADVDPGTDARVLNLMSAAPVQEEDTATKDTNESAKVDEELESVSFPTKAEPSARIVTVNGVALLEGNELEA